MAARSIGANGCQGRLCYLNDLETLPTTLRQIVAGIESPI